MDEHVKKLRLLLKFAMRVLSQLLSDLWAYYSSPYPLLLIVGVLRRIIRRANTLWLAKGRGRPSVGEDVVELILDMKRSNWTWGALRISQELLLPKVVQRNLREVSSKSQIRGVKQGWPLDVPSICPSSLINRYCYSGYFGIHSKIAMTFLELREK